MDAQDFPSAFVKAGCRRAQDCCNWGPSSTATPDAETRCEATADFSAALMGDLGQAVAERRAAFDAVRAASCIEKIQAASCGTRFDVTRTDTAGADCAAAVRGLMTVGAVCAGSWDCVPGFFCDAIPHATGKCISRRPAGAPCSSEEQCASGTCADSLCRDRPPICGG
jgi:hypothetical protein